jgi:hypothetical protein
MMASFALCNRRSIMAGSGSSRAASNKYSQLFYEAAGTPGFIFRCIALFDHPRLLCPKYPSLEIWLSTAFSDQKIRTNKGL